MARSLVTHRELAPTAEQASQLEAGGARVQDHGVPVLYQLHGPLGDALLLGEVLGPALDHVLLEAGLGLDHRPAVGADELSRGLQVAQVAADGGARDVELLAEFRHRGLALPLDALEDPHLPLFDEHAAVCHEQLSGRRSHAAIAHSCSKTGPAAGMSR